MLLFCNRLLWKKKYRDTFEKKYCDTKRIWIQKYRDTLKKKYRDTISILILLKKVFWNDK
jgi:hypothetical protein